MLRSFLILLEMLSLDGARVAPHHRDHGAVLVGDSDIVDARAPLGDDLDRALIDMVRSGHTDRVRHPSAGTPEVRRLLWIDPPGVCGRCYVGSRFQLRRWIVVTPWVTMADR